MQVMMHSYNRDMEVVELMKFVRGTVILLPNLLSRGINAAN